MRRVGLELVADAADVGDDPLAVVGRDRAPHQLGQLVARHDGSLRAGEGDEQLELDRGEVDGLAPPARAAPGDVELERAPPDRVGRAVHDAGG